MALLAVDRLVLEFPHDGGPPARVLDGVSFAVERGRVLDGVSFAVERGRVVGLVGESGCGKSMTALAIMRLVPPPGRVTDGRIVFDGTELLTLPEREMRRLRGARIAMIFQEPMTALNPVLTAGYQVAEAIRIHRDVSRRAAWERAVALLGEVGIPEPAARARDYPHQLSGGMRQRVMIAMAIACEPALLVADEPTTALDVTIQAEILDLLARLRAAHGMGLLLITHDLGIVAEQADRVAIMYAGRIVEEAPTVELFARPLHPYTRALMRAMPVLGAHRERLAAIPGNVPDVTRRPSGCSFRDRCELATAECATAPPPLADKGAGHTVACIHA